MSDDEITRLRAELAEARRDAERYRWLRIYRPLTLSLCLDTATTVDAAIDAAIAAESGDQSAPVEKEPKTLAWKGNYILDSHSEISGL